MAKRVVGYWIISRFDPTERTEIGVRSGVDPERVFDGMVRRIDFERYYVETIYELVSGE